jgi:hypothetical protein
MNNFNTMVAVVAGINASAVHRLKWTKEEVCEHTRRAQSRCDHQLTRERNATRTQVMKGIWPQFAECERLMSSEGSYKIYRAALFQARPPCLPYLCVPSSAHAPPHTSSANTRWVL